MAHMRQKGLLRPGYFVGELFGEPQLLFHLDPIGDILRKADHIGLRARLFPPVVLIQEVDLFAGLANDAEFAADRAFSSRMGLIYSSSNLMPVFFGDEFREVAAEHLLLFIAQDLAGGRIDGQELAVHIVGADKRLAMVEQVTISLFVNPYLFFEFLCLRDPDHIDDDLIEFAFRH